MKICIESELASVDKSGEGLRECGGEGNEKGETFD